MSPSLCVSFAVRVIMTLDVVTLTKVLYSKIVLANTGWIVCVVVCVPTTVFTEIPLRLASTDAAVISFLVTVGWSFPPYGAVSSSLASRYTSYVFFDVSPDSGTKMSVSPLVTALTPAKDVFVTATPAESVPALTCAADGAVAPLSSTTHQTFPVSVRRATSVALTPVTSTVLGYDATKNGAVVSVVRAATGPTTDRENSP
mmetsp:Transcript_8612/g.28766  ORF Transcript_8612/g.28766 Transcript_8612/m.28766 type:complete len:201 (-) Transcript_8612:121-723(-)